MCTCVHLHLCMYVLQSFGKRIIYPELPLVELTITMDDARTILDHFKEGCHPEALKYEKFVKNKDQQVLL